MFNPIVLSGHDIDRNEYQQILEFIKLKVTESYEFPPEILQVSGITIATLGNFSASVGKPKSKKTFNVSAIAASALSGKEVLHYTAKLPQGRHKVLYIDTEQSRCHCHKVMQRILQLAGMSTDRECDRLTFLMLREYSPKQRRQIIDLALAADHEIGLVIIDGLRDLLYDLNSPGESVDLINDLLRWSGFYNLHIHTILHLNKGDDNVRGHIGTELNNKAETVLQVTKSPFDPNISEVKAMHIRDREFSPFAFRINDDSLPELVTRYTFCQEEKISKGSITDRMHASVLQQVFKNGLIASYKTLIESIQSNYATIGYKRGRNACIELNKYLMGRGIITKEDSGYTYHPEIFETDRVK